MLSCKKCCAALILGLLMVFSTAARAQNPSGDSKKTDSCCPMDACPMDSCCCKGDSCQKELGSGNEAQRADSAQKSDCCCGGDSCAVKTNETKYMKGAKEKRDKGD